MSEDYVMKCPFCRTETKYIIRHIASYSALINQAEFKAHFKIYKEAKVKEDQRNRKRKSREKQRAEDEKKMKEDIARQKRANRAKQRAEDEAKVKEDQVKIKRKVGQLTKKK